MLWERTEVQTFLALAEELHFGRVAERLGLTTGRISQTIKKLERRIGAPLFERTSRQVSLTPLGRDLAADLAPLAQGMDEAVRRAVDPPACCGRDSSGRRPDSSSSRASKCSAGATPTAG
ncbi:LysR family transcriptional regulator [Streptomyces sp. NRRL F-5727]|uniref:LysR family transcriptional regulator n=1 Tax=Streptomyces sp. NRRL F-5727 TaxID=1463871 RepID=UPI00068AE512|nr:LysR family transcriptional regulator [Streptomyces sp. NRRL F-5727]